jgi:hypothetical protein
MHLCASCRLSYSTTMSAAACTSSGLPAACAPRGRSRAARPATPGRQRVRLTVVLAMLPPGCGMQYHEPYLVHATPGVTRVEHTGLATRTHYGLD